VVNIITKTGSKNKNKTKQQCLNFENHLLVVSIGAALLIKSSDYLQESFL